MVENWCAAHNKPANICAYVHKNVDKSDVFIEITCLSTSLLTCIHNVCG